MEISDALEIIKRNLKNNVIESGHFREQCEERNLNTEIVQRIIEENKILGILEQEEGLYKIWFFYEKYKDLNIIIKILPNGKLRFITIFPCYSERRKK